MWPNYDAKVLVKVQTTIFTNRAVLICSKSAKLSLHDRLSRLIIIITLKHKSIVHIWTPHHCKQYLHITMTISLILH